MLRVSFLCTSTCIEPILGRTDYQLNAFTIEIPAKDAVSAFITTYPGWFAGIIILVVAIIICIVVIIVKVSGRINDY